MKLRSKSNFLSIFLAISIGFSVSGCGNSDSTTNGANTKGSSVQTTDAWLEDWSAEASTQAQQAFVKFEKTTDSFEGESYFDLPDNELSPIEINKPFFRWNIYSGEPTKNLYLPLLSVGFAGEDWQFYESLKVKFGEDVREFKMLDQPQREVGSGGLISEILLFTISIDDVKFLSQVFTAGNPEVRLSGSKAIITDLQFSAVEMENLKNVLLAYKYIVNSEIKP